MAGKKPAKSPKLDDAAAEGEEGAVAEADSTDRHQQVLERIVNIQNEIDGLNEKASEEILHVEQKYNRLRQPHFERRSELIRELPDFWPMTLLNHPQFSELLGEEDETVFQYLENIKVDEFEDVKSGYKVSMYFRTNPYFDNEILSKEYALDTNGESMIKGSEIIWKDGKNITEKVGGEIKGRKRGHEDIASFFLWFSDLDPTSDEPAELIKDDIWPNPLQFYLGGDTSVEVEEGDYDGEEDDGLEAEEDEEEEDGEGEEDAEGEEDEIVELSEDEEEEEEA